MNTKDFKRSKGITLIALVVTIIVLLILAGVSILALTGDNGILTNAQQTSTQSAYKGAEEQVELAYTAVKTEIMAKTVANGTYNPLDQEETTRLAGIVKNDLGITNGDSNGKWSVDSSTPGVIKITYTDSKIDQGVMGEATITKLGDKTDTVAIPREEGVVHYQINLLEEQDAKLYVDTADDIGVVFFGTTSSDSGVGYYADVDGDGTIDGIIFADLAVGNTNHSGNDGIKGKGLGMEYSIQQVSTGLKKYEMATTEETTPRKYLRAVTTGIDRFYVVALNNVDNSKYNWYTNAFGYMDTSDTTTDFGTGKANSEKIIQRALEATDTTGYRKLESYDLWYILTGNLDNWTANMRTLWSTSGYQAIKSNKNEGWNDLLKNGWFVPSNGEFAAMGGELSQQEIQSLALPSNWYWSSSQRTNKIAWFAQFDCEMLTIGYINGDVNNSGQFVRLATTF